MLAEPFGQAHKFIPKCELKEASGSVCSAAQCFVTPETEYVPFNNRLRRYGKPRNTTLYAHLKPFYGEYKYLLDLMILLDYIVLNEDRHTSDFGLMRCAETRAAENLRRFCQTGQV